MRIIKVGSRGSKLALWQTDSVIGQLQEQDASLQFQVNIIKTKGDKLLDVALSRIGDKGLFTKEIENELLAGSIDFAVHSMKDLPTDIPGGLALGAVLKREDVSDVLLTVDGKKLCDLPKGAQIGTSSLRRRAQLLRLRPDIEITELRGNIDTRIKRLREEGLDGIILAAAGVKRLGYQDMISESLDFLPAVGQGAIGIEIRDDDPETRRVVQLLHDPETEAAVICERALLAGLEGGCQVPIGAYAAIENGSMRIEAMVSDLHGRQMCRDQMSGSLSDASAIGAALANKLKKQGADTILQEIRTQENQ